MRAKMGQLAVLLLVTTSSVFCQDFWAQKSNFAGSPRGGAASFVIGDFAYTGMGYVDHIGEVNDWWSYDPLADVWTQKADFPGTAREHAVAFSIGNNGYLGIGDGVGFFSDFWEYNPVKNEWTVKAGFPGVARYGAAGFSIGNKGYIGTGQVLHSLATLNDFWEYDPAANAWTQKADFAGDNRQLATGFSIGHNGYLGLGTGYSSTGYYKDFWQYLPGSDTWVRKADFPGAARYLATGFSIDSSGYVGGGFNPTTLYLKDFWEYYQPEDKWVQKADFAGTARYVATGFSAGGKGYLGTGLDVTGTYKNDLWEYNPAVAVSTEHSPMVSFDPIAAGTLPGNISMQTVDGNGNIYGLDNAGRISRLNTDGTVTYIAGNGIAGYADGAAANAQFNKPKIGAVDAAGNIYVADLHNYAVRKITPAGIVTTLAGNGTAGSQDGTGTAALFNGPADLTIDKAGNIYVADLYRIRKVSPAGNVITFAGNVNPGWQDGQGELARFEGMEHIAIDPEGNLYVSNTYSPLRKISASGFVSTISFSGGQNFLLGVCADKPGNVYVSVVDGANSSIYKVFPKGSFFPLVGAANGYQDGSGTAVQFNFPTNLAADDSGNLYVTDEKNFVTRKISTPRLQLTGIANTASVAGYFMISGNYLNGAASLQAPSAFELSLSEAGPYTNTLSIPSVSGEIHILKVFVRIAGNVAAGTYNDAVMLSASGAVTNRLGISGLVAPPPVRGLQAEYFNNTNLAAPSVLTRIDKVINNDFVFTSPEPGTVNTENYSVRWSGQVKPQFSEVYTFYAVTDDGVRLWVNGKLLIDNWTNQGATEKSGSIALLAGQLYDIEMEYFQGSGLAVSKLLWASAGTPRAIIPTAHLYPPVEGSGTGLRAEYFNNAGLTPPSVLVRTDAVINNDFVFKSPAPGTVNIENYSARWTGQVKPQYSETYTFYAVTDDGVRLWVNGVLLIDNWNHQGATEKSGSIALQAGQLYDIEMEYFQGSGLAVSKLLWSSASTTKAIIPRAQLYLPASDGTGLQGTYFNNTGLTGGAALTRIDPVINNDFVFKSPAPGTVNIENYSVRWTGQVLPQFSETYTFYAITDDGVRLWVNNVLLIDNWTNQNAAEKSGSIELQAGQKYDIVMDYFQGTGFAVSKLLWSSAGTAKGIVPKTRLFPTLAAARVMEEAADLRTAAVQKQAAVRTNVYPNPVKPGQLVSLQMLASNNTPVAIRLIAGDGTIVRTEQRLLVAGVNTIVLGTGKLAQGVYIINIMGAGKPVNLKLMVE